MIATIDGGRAERARAIYNAALSQPIVTPLTDDELAELDAQFDGRDCGVKHSNTPHKQSAYAHLPMRGISHSKSSTQIDRNGYAGIYVSVSAEAQKRNAIALWPDAKFKRVKPRKDQMIPGNAYQGTVKPNAPHPQSSYSHLPLTGMGLEGGHPIRKWTLTAEEKRTLAARPLRYASVPTDIDRESTFPETK